MPTPRYSKILRQEEAWTIKEALVAIRIVQIGMGGWGQIWGGIVRRSTDAELVACVDMDPAALAQARKQLGIPPERCFGSIEQAFAAVECDAVLITTFLPAHVPLALAALEAGKHVLLEKPFAPTLAEARRVVDAAAQRERVLMISQNYRFYPAVRTVAALVREGTLGPVSGVSIDFRRYANAAPPEGNRHYMLRQPLLLDMAIHHFDLMRMVLGQEPRQVNCHAWNPPWSKFAEPASATATVTFDGGAVVSYRGSWISPGRQTYWAGEWHMECERGEIFWTSRDDEGTGGERVTVQLLGKPARRVKLPELPAIDQAGSLAAFAQAIRTGHEPESSGRQNLGSLALAFATIESATAGLPVFVTQP
jgi:predicted dehydrogenase